MSATGDGAPDAAPSAWSPPPGPAHRLPVVGSGFLLFLMAWPVLWSNHKNQDPADPLRLLVLPEALRFIEPTAIVAALFLVVMVGRPRSVPLGRRVAWCLAALGVAGVCGAALAWPGVVNAGYGIYATAVPMLLLWTVLLLGFGADTLRRYTLYLLVLCGVNWIAGWYQVARFGLQIADYVHGFFEDANVLANVFYQLIAFLLFYYAATRARRSLVAALVLLPIAYFAFDEKLNWMFLLLVVPFTLARMRARPLTTVLFVIAGGVAAAATVEYASQRGLQNRVAAVVDIVRARGGLFELGLFQSYVTAWRQVSGSVPSLLIGTGPSNYGGAVASNRVNRGEGTAISEELLVRRKHELGAFDSRVNFFANVLGEFGLVGCAAVGFFLVSVVVALWRARRARDPLVAAWASAALFGWIMIAGQAAWVPFGVFENLMVVGPVALVTGIVAATTADERPEPARAR